MISTLLLTPYMGTLVPYLEAILPLHDIDFFLVEFCNG